MTTPPAEAPLSGVRVIELAGIGPGPFAGQVLSDMGAEVIVVDRPSPSPVAMFRAAERRGKRSVILDLRAEAGRDALLDLAATADALIEGYRPGVCERLGIGPEDVQARNPRLVFGRMTGWGQQGPWAPMAGHDINYISVTGALHAMGEAGRPPTPPLNLVGDFGGGSMFLIAGLLAGIVRARTTGEGCVVDAAICDGVSAMMGMMHSMTAAGAWSTTREANLLDGGAPFYRCYACADGGWFAVGAIEPQFHAKLLQGLGIDPQEHGAQRDRALWPAQTERIAAAFAAEPRAHWEAVFDGVDACATPVLDLAEAQAHPHMSARGAFARAEGVAQPAGAPRTASPGAGFPAAAPPPFALPGAHGRAILSEIGRDPDQIAAMAADGVTVLPDAAA